MKTKESYLEALDRLPENLRRVFLDGSWDLEGKSMSDNETRREDARIERALGRALSRGDMGYCFCCGGITSNMDKIGEDEFRWMCKPCQRMADEPGD